MIEELEEIWNAEGKWRIRPLDCVPVVKRLPEWQIQKARQDYEVATNPTMNRHRYEFADDYIALCKRTHWVVKEHLLEALTSPCSYVREWGRLITRS